MPRPPSPGPTERELDLLAVLWERGPSRVREVHDALGDDAGFTTVQTMLQVMFDKGLVKRAKEGRSYVYRAALSEAEAQRSLLGDLLERAFGGSAKALVSRALDLRPVDAAELAEIEALVQRARAAEDDDA